MPPAATAAACGAIGFACAPPALLSAPGRPELLLRPWGLVEQVFDIVDQLVGGLSFRVRGGRGDQSGHQQKQSETSHPASLYGKVAPEQ